MLGYNVGAAAMMGVARRKVLVYLEGKCLCSLRGVWLDSHGWKGIRSYSIISFWEQCWQKRETVRRERREKEKQILVSHKARVVSMLDNVQQIRLTEQVPIVCAVDKFMSEVNPKHN